MYLLGDSMIEWHTLRVTKFYNNVFYYSSILVFVVLEVFTHYEADFEVSVFLIKNFIGSRFKIL